MIPGSCLCGGVRFEIAAAVGPFELCHCNRCRKATGSAFVAGLGVMKRDFHWLAGRELIDHYDAPILKRPPPYRSHFCRRCGSPVPNPEPEGSWLEIPAGLLDGDPGLQPQQHIYVELVPPWSPISDDLPQLDEAALVAQRRAARRARSESS